MHDAISVISPPQCWLRHIGLSRSWPRFLISSPLTPNAHSAPFSTYAYLCFHPSVPDRRHIALNSHRSQMTKSKWPHIVNHNVAIGWVKGCHFITKRSYHALLNFYEDVWDCVTKWRILATRVPLANPTWQPPHRRCSLYSSRFM